MAKSTAFKTRHRTGQDSIDLLPMTDTQKTVGHVARARPVRTLLSLSFMQDCQLYNYTGRCKRMTTTAEDTTG